MTYKIAQFITLGAVLGYIFTTSCFAQTFIKESITKKILFRSPHRLMKNNKIDVMENSEENTSAEHYHRRFAFIHHQRARKERMECLSLIC